MRLRAERHRLHGVTVELDPRAMRRGASRLLDVKVELNRQGTLLGQRTIPDMPFDVLAAVQSTLAPMGVQLKDHGARLASHGEDLRRRALLADIADELRNHQPISQHQMNLLLMWAKDGTIWNVAGPKRAEMIGQVLGQYYQSHFDAGHVRELAKVIEAGKKGRYFGDFGAGLVNVWGGRYPALALTIIEGGGPALEEDGDAQRVVGDLALLLAAASTSRKLTQDTTDHIAGNPDSVAVALLLSSSHPYAPGFLGAVARGQLTQKTGAENRLDRPVPWHRFNAETVIMEAVGRDPHAAASFFGPADRGGTNDVMRAVYGRDWDDGGTALGHAFSEAVDDDIAHGQGHDAAALTRTTIDQILGSNADDRHAGRVRDFVGNTLADHYMSDLYHSADTPNNSSTPAIRVDGRHVYLSHAHTVDLLENMLGRDSASANLMNGIAAHQTNLAAHGASSHGGTGWAKQIGSFDGTLQTAYEHLKIHEFDAAQARADMINKILEVPLAAVELPTAGSIAADQIPDLVDKLFGPHGIPPSDASDVFKHHLYDQIDAGIASAYIEHGGLDHVNREADALLKQFTRNGHMVPWNEMTDHQLGAYNRWKGLEPVHRVLGDPLNEAHDAFFGNDQDQFG
ncbi:MAG TPA: hypothetical protein VGF23_00825 [Gaiellaceae bacterium]|jgi:hypothetical protein